MIEGKSEYLNIIFEDNHLLIVNKPPGLLVQGDVTADKTLLDYAREYLKVKYQKPGNVYLGVVHRIDRPVSGVVVLAKTSKAASRLFKQFSQRSVEKTYWAVVSQKPPAMQGRLEHYLVKNKDKNISFVVKSETKGAKLASLHYQTIRQLKGNFYLLEVKPITGRSHQIRVQLAAIKCPIIGDLKYGYPKANLDGNISLHAHSIEFIHPVQKEKVTFEASMPQTASWQELQI